MGPWVLGFRQNPQTSCAESHQFTADIVLFDPCWVEQTKRGRWRTCLVCLSIVYPQIFTMYTICFSIFNPRFISSWVRRGWAKYRRGTNRRANAQTFQFAKRVVARISECICLRETGCSVALADLTSVVCSFDACLCFASPEKAHLWRLKWLLATV